MEFTVSSVCETSKLDSVSIRINVLLCVIGDMYKISTH